MSQQLPPLPPQWSALYTATVEMMARFEGNGEIEGRTGSLSRNRTDDIKSTDAVTAALMDIGGKTFSPEGLVISAPKWKHGMLGVAYYEDGQPEIVEWRETRQCMLGPRAGERGPGFVSHAAGFLPVDPVRVDPLPGRARDKAQEFAQYMAKGAEQLIEAAGRLFEAQEALENADDDAEELRDGLALAGSEYDDYARGLRSDIYEFRKRVPAVTPKD